MSKSADFVRRARERLKLNQTEFGDLLGVSKRTVIRWEQGGPLKKRDRIAISLVAERDKPKEESVRP